MRYFGQFVNLKSLRNALHLEETLPGVSTWLHCKIRLRLYLGWRDKKRGRIAIESANAKLQPRPVDCLPFKETVGRRERKILSVTVSLHVSFKDVSNGSSDSAQQRLFVRNINL